jgi:hypothetical protein
LAFQSFDYDRTSSGLFQKRVLIRANKNVNISFNV